MGKRLRSHEPLRHEGNAAPFQIDVDSGWFVVNRRGFLKGALAGVGAVAAGGVSGLIALARRETGWRSVEEFADDWLYAIVPPDAVGDLRGLAEVGRLETVRYIDSDDELWGEGTLATHRQMDRQQFQRRRKGRSQPDFMRYMR